MEKIFLNSYDSKKAVNVNNSVSVNLKGNRKLLPLNDFGEVISQYDQYIEERKNCNKIRLTCQVNTLCSNVLFNKITEIVKREGSNNVVNVNYGIGDDVEFGNVVYKSQKISFWSSGDMRYQSTDLKITTELNYDRTKPISSAVKDIRYNDDGILESNNSWHHPTNSIRDTQLSKNNDGEHFVYHCGLDFLNNHLIRSNTFRTVCKMPKIFKRSYSAFNTIADLMRDVNGYKICEKYYFPVKANVKDGAKYVAMHLYNQDNIDTFEESVKNNLIFKYDGWVGFENKSKIKSYSDFKNNDCLDIDRPLMYMNGGDFVDMYPSRDLFSFVPKYNKYQNRLEKNWNYCITYPSSSYTPSESGQPFSDIIEPNDGVNSLKAIYFDENTRADNGTSQLVIYSISKHGLNAGDYVNIYKTYEKEVENPKEGEPSSVTVTEKIIDNAEVSEVVDDYIFTTFNSYFQISNEWVYLSDEDLKSTTLEISSETKVTTYKLDKSKKFYTISNLINSPKYYIINNRYVNFDDNALRISYKKVVGDIECEYYVRIFSKLPNFKFSSASTNNQYELYKNFGETISCYQAHEYEFENHLSKLAFADNIYGDEMAEIVFTDDIDLSYLKDNLGRPLSSLYFTVIKNNQGYKEWYGFDLPNKGKYWSTNIIRNNYKDIEFSHCFGKITCGIDASEESIYDSNIASIKKINNIEGTSGYDVSLINEMENRKFSYIGDKEFRIDDYEISYLTDKHFYGDLCYYDAYNAIERPIQPILHRFNSAQRECNNTSSAKFYTNFTYDEIVKDDYDTGDKFIVKTNNFLTNGNNKLCLFKEGYYYNPHYEIPIKTFDKAQTVMPDFLTIRELVRKSDGMYRITTLQKHFLKMGDKAMIYDRINEKYYILKVIENVNDNVFICYSYLDSDEEFTCDITFVDSSGNTQTLVYLNRGNDLYTAYKLFKIDNLNVPSYARVLKDGTCRIIWRNLLNNGESLNKDIIEEYPFTNGAFYINKRIDLYTRRQDPQNRWALYSEIDAIGNETDISMENDYVKEDEIKC